MKRVRLCETAYIDLTEEQYNNCETTNVIGKKTRELLFMAKNIQLPKNMVLIVPLTEFKDIND